MKYIPGKTYTVTLDGFIISDKYRNAFLMRTSIQDILTPTTIRYT